MSFWDFIFGLLILVLPFTIVFFTTDRGRAFSRIFIGLALFHSAVCLITQYFAIFTYAVIISIYLSGLVVLFAVFYIKKGRGMNVQGVVRSVLKADKKDLIFPVLALLIAVYGLMLVRYGYTGTVSTILGYRQAVDNSYPYPIFSDEWVGAGMARDSIETHSLPTENTLRPESQRNFVNPFILFNSMTAGAILLLGLDPITGYPVISILSGLTVLLSVYFLTWSITKKHYLASISAISMMFVVNGANIPGIWFHLPFISGTIFYLFSISSSINGDRYGFFVANIFSILLYPPLVIFSIPTAIYLIIKNKWLTAKSLKLSLLAVLAVVVTGTIILLSKYSIDSVYAYIVTNIVRDNLVGGVTHFPIWYVIPVPFIVLLVIGYMRGLIDKDYTFIIPTFIGLLYWVAYMFTMSLFLIDHSRAVMITAIISMPMVATGLGWVLNRYVTSAKFTETIKYSSFFIFLILIMFYPYDMWKKHLLTINASPVPSQKALNKKHEPMRVMPASPINRYLHPDDIRLFAENNIEEKKFISHPWKGLVIGVATKNYPLHSKASTMTVSTFQYERFMTYNCEKKILEAKKFGIDYVYSAEFDCDGAFKELGRSEEGFVLYQFVNE